MKDNSVLVLKGYVERIEKIEENHAAIKQDVKEVLEEARDAGFNTKILRAVIRRRKMDPVRRADEDAKLALYESVFGGA